METAILGGGCFWCLEALFERVQGVQAVTSGYCGGHMSYPSYAQVCEGVTGHAEVVRIDFDPREITYQELLGIFFAVHDPTTLNQQGNDVGNQYRSVIFYQSQRQQQTAAALIKDFTTQQILEAPIVTEIAPAQPFFPAEEYHQQYFRRNPGQGYCTFVVGPKLAKFKKQFLTRLKSEYR